MGRQEHSKSSPRAPKSGPRPLKTAQKHPKTLQKRPKSPQERPKTSQRRPKTPLWSALGTVLGASWNHQKTLSKTRRFRVNLPKLLGSILEPKMAKNGPNLGPKRGPKLIQNRCRKWCEILIDFGGPLGGLRAAATHQTFCNRTPGSAV